MHTPLLQGNTFEKVLRDPAGRLARVTFFVYEHGGRVKARVVGVTLLEAPAATKAPKLVGTVVSGTAPTDVAVAHAILSPYFDSNLLYTSGSKPRAPSHE